ncbi:MAG: hypothetical protein IKE46_02075 [Selenomonadaceae bacterium]|nr:hypothetical protein [Selenomonadaceae bacterium]
MSTSVDTMKKFFNVLKLYSYDTTTDAITILDQAVRTVSHFASLQDAVNHFLIDIANTTATTGNPWQSLYQTCGIAIGADYDFSVDTGSASGYNAGMGVVKNAQDIVPENALLTQFSVPASGSTTYHTYTGNDGRSFSYAITYPSNLLEVVDVATSPLDENGYADSTFAQKTYLQAGQSYSTLNDNNQPDRTQPAESIVTSIQTVMTGVESFWADQSLKLIYDTFGLDFNGKVLTIAFGVNQKSLAETGPIAGDIGLTASVPANNIVMLIDSVVNTPIDAADPNGNTYVAGGSASGYLDRTIVHELVHATMQASGTMKNGMPEFVTEGLAELIHGVDDYSGLRTTAMLELAADSERLAAAVPFKEGTMTHDAYPAGYMFMRYLLHQSLPTNVVIGNGATPDLFTYTGGEEVLSNSASGSQINFGAGIDISSGSIAGDDLFLSTTAGTLIIRDTRNKILNFADSTGTVKTRSYFAGTAGTVDGRAFGEREVIYGADNANNEIYAGNGGSQLWGGDYGNDYLFGGSGVDEFIAGVGCGNDVIGNANSSDVINLVATTLSQITGANVNSNGVALNFSDGSSLTVAGEVNATFKLSDGSTYLANQSTGQWTQTN